MNRSINEPTARRVEISNKASDDGTMRQRTIRSAAEGDSGLPPVLDVPQAAAMLGLGRTAAYKLVAEQRWPTPVLRLGRLIKIPTQPLLELLRGAWPPVGVGVGQSAGAAAAAASGPVVHRR